MRHTITHMRIGIDCRLPTYRMGGISQYVIYLIQGLGRLRNDHEFVIGHSHKEGRLFLPSGKPNFSRNELWTPCHHRYERYLLGLELSFRGFNVYHSPDFIPPMMRGARRVITVHDLTFLHFPEFLTAESKRYYAGQIEWAVEVADHIIADSEATRADLIRLLSVPPGKVTSIHLAANPALAGEFSPESVRQTLKSLDLSPGFVLAVGTLEPRKNLPMLVRAYERLRRVHSIRVPLVLVGKAGWLYEDLFLEIQRLGLGKHVIHFPDLQDVQLAHLYRAAGVLAFPSHYEGFGLPALEAMHGGCPVIASNRGSLPEIVGEAGLLLNPTEVDLWTDTLYRVLFDEEMSSRMSREGQLQAQKFTWDRTAEATLRVYESLGES